MSTTTRIIPARAGFTPTPRDAPPRPQDHPRSRGVYVALRGVAVLAVGSSPLARGLRTAPQAGAAVPGIIPARAGFTPRRGAPGRPGGDHPRSRGVYQTGSETRLESYGSSPLARGLRLRKGVVGAPVGIIPARAGFTPPPWVTAAGPVDHPRSRGVYVRGRGSPAGGRGSSPLARGLRRRHG